MAEKGDILRIDNGDLGAICSPCGAFSLISCPFINRFGRDTFQIEA